MQLIKPGVNIDFIGKRQIAFIISAVLLLASIGSLAVKGIKLGVEFEGGTLIQIQFPSKVDIRDIKSGLKPMGLDKSSVQQYGDKDKYEYLIRTNIPATTSKGFTKNLETNLKTATGLQAEIERIEMVGPQIGHDIILHGGAAA